MKTIRTIAAIGDGLEIFEDDEGKGGVARSSSSSSNATAASAGLDQMIAAVVLGGSYHWIGAIIGAAVFTALPVIAQAIVPEFQDVANGVVLLLIMIFLPRGLVDPRAIRLRRGARNALAQAPAQVAARAGGGAT